MYFTIVSSVVFVRAVFAQQLYPTPRGTNFGECSLPTDNDLLLGEYDRFSTSGLLPSLFITGDGTAAPSLRVIRSRVTCLNTGTRRNTASSVGIVVEYERDNMPGTSLLAQVTVDCIPDPHNAMSNFSFYPTPAPGATGNALNTATIRSGSPLNEIVNVNATFSTELRVDCGECSTATSSRQDPASTCVGCLADCNSGSGRCLGFLAVNGNQCCRYFLDDRCVQFCPGSLTPNNVTFDCGCGTLSLTNGMVSYSADQRVGSVATYSCTTNDGYVLPPEATPSRTCIENGWTGEDPTCQLHDCKETTLANPQNGDYVLETGTTTFGACVTFKCLESYTLIGETTVRNCTLNGWSGCTPRCVVSNTTVEATSEPTICTESVSSGISTSILAISVLIAFVMGNMVAAVLGVVVAMVVYKIHTTKHSKSTKNVPNAQQSENNEVLYEEMVVATGIEMNENESYGRLTSAS